MISNFALYIKEREGVDIIEDDKGFVTFQHSPSRKELMIHDCFVKKEYRRNNIATKWFDKLTVLAKELNCKSLVTTTDPETEGHYVAEQALINYGFEFEIHLEESGLNFFKKRI